jgi:hypothetical protein
MSNISAEQVKVDAYFGRRCRGTLVKGDIKDNLGITGYRQPSIVGKLLF